MLRTKKKTPAELVRQIRDAVTVIEKQSPSERSNSKVADELAKRFQQAKALLHGDPDAEPNQDLILAYLNEMFSNSLVSRLLTDLPVLEFEARKDVVSIITMMLHKEFNGRNPTAEHIAQNPEIMELLLLGYDNPEIALNCGAILRECLKHEALAKVLLFSSSFFKFFTFVEVSNFDVASDAFATFKDLLTLHKEISSQVLENNYDVVFNSYKQLLQSKNYVTRRLSLKLLGELLLDRTHFNIMTRYISEPRNLKLMMNMLRDKSKNIQFEAFHVFKVFVANPNKPEPILEILLNNQSRLIDFLKHFQNDKEADDEQFKDEKAFLIKQVEQLHR